MGAWEMKGTCDIYHVIFMSEGWAQSSASKAHAIGGRDFRGNAFVMGWDNRLTPGRSHASSYNDLYK